MKTKTTYHPNGQKERVSHFDEQGLAQGLSQTYYPAGQKKTAVTYRDDRPHGEEIYWAECGAVIHRRSFINGIEVTNHQPKDATK